MLLAEPDRRYAATIIGELTLCTLGPNEERVVQRLQRDLPTQVVTLRQ